MKHGGCIISTINSKNQTTGQANFVKGEKQRQAEKLGFRVSEIHMFVVDLVCIEHLTEKFLSLFEYIIIKI